MSDPGAGVPEEEPMEEERAQMEDEMDESDEDDTNDTSVSECEKEEKGGKKKVSASKEAGRSKTKNTRSKQRKRKRSVNQRRNIRKVLKTDQLDPKTLEAQQEEQERLKRLEALKNVTSPKQGQGSKQKKHQQKKKKQEHETEGQIIHRQHSTDAIHPQLSLEALVANLKSTSRSDKAGQSNSEEGTQAAQDQPSGITDTISATDSNTGKSALSQEIDTVTEVLSDAESFSESDYSDEDVIVLDDDDDNDDDIISQKEVVLVLSSEEEEDSTDEEDDADDNGDIGSHTNDNLNQANDIGKVLVNVGHPVDEPDIFLPPQITRAVKPHQIGGIRFLYDNIVESLNRCNVGHGFGCILAHSMGLGKTLQVISFIDVYLRHTPAKKVLCVVPINTIQNWLNEFDMWLPKDPSKKEEKESQDTEPSEDGRATKKESSKKQTSSKGKRKRGKALNDKESLNSEATATTEESLDGGNQATEYKLLNDNDNAAEGEDSVKEAASDRGEDVSREERLAKDEVCTEKEVNSTSEGGIIKPAADTKEVKEDATADGEQMSTDGEAREKGELSVEQVSSEIRLSATEEESPRENGSKVGESVRGAGSTDERVTPNLELAKESEPAMKDEPSISNQSGQDSEVLTEGQSSIGAQEKLKDEPKVHYRDFDVFLIGDGQKNTLSRAKVVGTWHQEGGVLLIGYEMFRMISMYTASLCNSVTNVKGKRRKLKAKKLPAVIDIEEEEREMQLILGMQRALCKPGPDLVICDEGHRIKNYQSNISQALHKIRTRKRLVLTGYPLQNNLMEYWCMVDFVRPLYLGSRHDFANMFERPIVNGQCLDSNAHDKRLMRYRAHVLHSLLQGFVQRRGYSVLKQALPPKEEHVIMVKLSRIQQALYRRFIELCTEGYGEQLNPIRIFAVCSKIWNHPDVLYKAMNGGKSGKGVNLFDTDEDFAPEDGTNKNKSKSQSRTGFGSSNVLDGLNPFGAEARVLLMMAADWAKAVYDSHDYNDGLIETSGKMILLMEILNESIAHGDKLLVFSQSLMTLDLIEELLNKTPLTETSETTSTDQERKQPKRWKKDRDYFRIDGGTPATEREKLINRFNNKENKEIKLFLLSTRAGCLGINLVGANRVVVFDVSWNPCHDAQAVCRVYRYGQEKPCFIYRFVASNTMEKRMYYRQISKQGVSDRVIDELNPAENFYKDELHKLLASNWEEESDQDYNQEASHIADPVLKKLMLQNGTWIQTTPFKHESLLEDQKGMKLSKAEKKEAKRGYEEEKRYASGGRSNFAIGMPLAPRPYLSTDKPVMSVRPMVQTSSTQSDTSTTFSPILAPFPPETLHHFGGTTPPPETFILRLPNPTSNVTVINLSTPSSAGSITTLPSILPSVPGWTRNRSGSASSSWTQSSSDIRTSDSFTSTTSESATDVRQLPHLVPAFSTSASLSRPTDAGTDNTGSTRTESPTESQRALLAQIPMSTLTALYSFGDEGKLLLPDGRVIANPYMPTRGSTAGSHSRDKDGGSDNPILIDDEEDE